MKKVFLFMMLCCTLVVSAAEAVLLRIPAGSLTVVDVPFKVESVSVSNKDIVRVEVLNDRQARINGMKSGVTDVQLLGGNMSQVYTVTVVDDIRETFNALKRDLDAVPEIDFSINNGRIVIKGELSNIANWELKRKVLGAYIGMILDLTTFHPTPEVMLNLQKNFEKAGFTVVRNGAETAPGQISITQVGETLTVSGTVYNPADLKTIDNVLSSQPWLTLNNAAAANNSALVKAFVNVQVLPVMLQIDVVHMAINKTEADAAGIDWSQFVNNGFIGVTDLWYALDKVRGNKTVKTANSYAGAGTNGPLTAFLSLFGENGFNRARRAGFLTFKSNDTQDFRKLQSGGTLYLNSAPGAASGNVISTLTEVQYGLILEVKGGLTGTDSVAIELKQELSYPALSSPQGAQFDLKKFTTSTSVSCKLNETVAIGGLREFLQSNSNSQSLPYLRNIPGLKWLISQEGNSFNDDQVLTLISVRLMAKSTEIDSVAVELEKMKQAEDKAIVEREQKVEKRGWWFW